MGQHWVLALPLLLPACPGLLWTYLCHQLSLLLFYLLFLSCFPCLPANEQHGQWAFVLALGLLPGPYRYGCFILPYSGSQEVPQKVSSTVFIAGSRVHSLALFGEPPRCILSLMGNPLPSEELGNIGGMGYQEHLRYIQE